MDSLTQLTLGVAVAEATIGKKVGRKASLWGAVLGTFPDLDVFIPMGHAVDNFTYHRSFSHSLIILSIIAPFFVWLIRKIHPNDSVSWKNWFATVYLVLITHPILDSFTVYGTQLFWPITEYPVSIGSVFIIDPAYTLPLLLGVFLYVVFSQKKWAYYANLIGIGVTSVYLIWSFVVQQQFHIKAKIQFLKNNTEFDRILVQPTPINTLLWRIVATNDEGYLVGYRSVFDEPGDIVFRQYDSDESLLEKIEEHPPVKRLKWFTHGFYRVFERDGKIVISDLRMGLEPDGYVFQFAVGERAPDGIQAITPERVEAPRSFDQAGKLFKRIVDQDAPMTW